MGDGILVDVGVLLGVVVGEAVGIRVGVGVGVSVGVNEGLCVGDELGVGVGVDEAWRVRVGVALCVRVLVTEGVRVMVRVAVMVGVHGGANMENRSLNRGRKSRSARGRFRKKSASSHSWNSLPSDATRSVATKSAAVPRPSQFTSATRSRGSTVAGGDAVRVAVAVDVSEAGTSTGGVTAAARAADRSLATPAKKKNSSALNTSSPFVHRV